MNYDNCYCTWPFKFPVEIFTDVVNGAFVVNASGADGYKGQEGGNGSVATASADRVSLFT